MATFANPENILTCNEEIKSEKGALPAKRKPELTSVDEENIHEETDDSNKKLKLGNDLSVENEHSIEKNGPVIPDIEEKKDVNGTKNDSTHEEQVLEDEGNERREDYEDEEEDEDEDEDEFNDGEEDSDDEASNANADIVQGKGKGIMTDDKGKGKLVEASEDSNDSGSESDTGSDLSDDPLAEIDMDNILPSRTRTRRPLPGVTFKNEGTKDDEDDTD